MLIRLKLDWILKRGGWGRRWTTERERESGRRAAEMLKSGQQGWEKCPRMCDGWVEEFAPLSTQRDYTWQLSVKVGHLIFLRVRVEAQVAPLWPQRLWGFASVRHHCIHPSRFPMQENRSIHLTDCLGVLLQRALRRWRRRASTWVSFKHGSLCRFQFQYFRHKVLSVLLFSIKTYSFCFWNFLSRLEDIHLKMLGLSFFWRKKMSIQIDSWVQEGMFL